MMLLSERVKNKTRFARFCCHQPKLRSNFPAFRYCAIALFAAVFAFAALAMPQNAYGAEVVNIGTVQLGESGLGWTFTNIPSVGNVLTVNENAVVTITGSDTSGRRIIVEGNATVTLLGVNITTPNWFPSPITINQGVVLDLHLSGDNYLRGGINVPAIRVEGSTLRIDGSGSLTAYGGANAAAIGGSPWDTILQNHVGNIEIHGGTIAATGGGFGAGIGGGNFQSSGIVTITGGTVIATGGNYGAGIGGGNNGGGGVVTVTGGAITATGGTGGADIGNGSSGVGGTVNTPGGGTINGRCVTCDRVNNTTYCCTACNPCQAYSPCCNVCGHCVNYGDCCIDCGVCIYVGGCCLDCGICIHTGGCCLDCGICIHAGGCCIDCGICIHTGGCCLNCGICVHVGGCCLDCGICVHVGGCCIDCGVCIYNGGCCDICNPCACPPLYYCSYCQDSGDCCVQCNPCACPLPYYCDYCQDSGDCCVQCNPCDCPITDGGGSGNNSTPPNPPTNQSPPQTDAATPGGTPSSTSNDTPDDGSAAAPAYTPAPITTIAFTADEARTLADIGEYLSLDFTHGAITLPPQKLHYIAYLTEANDISVEIHLVVTQIESDTPHFSVEVSMQIGEHIIESFTTPVAVSIPIFATMSISSSIPASAAIDSAYVEGLNPYRVIALDEYGTIIGGQFCTEEGVFLFNANASGVFYVKYAQNLTRLVLSPHSYTFTCVASGATFAMDTTPAVIDGRLLLPVRFIAEALGAEIGRTRAADGTQIIFLTLHGETITMPVGEITPQLAALGMDVPAMVYNSRTMVPVRFVGQFFGAMVTWDGSTVQIIKFAPSQG